VIEARAQRGYFLRNEAPKWLDVHLPNTVDEEDLRLSIAIAEACNQGRMPKQCSQLEVARIFDATRPRVFRVLCQLAAIGMVERRPGNGWSFAMSTTSSRARAESYAFRSIVEPAALLEDTFELDRDWMERSRARHVAFRKRQWRNTMAIELFELNSDFHEQLARCSGNRYLLEAVQRQNRLRSFLNIVWVNGAERVIDSIDEHLKILDAVAAGDNRAAHNMMIAHLNVAKSVRSTV
jgi:DNA-binding GntR family transcriptional regulator